MDGECIDCAATIEIPSDALEGEIVGCPDCGLDFVIVQEDGSLVIHELLIDGEDWGE